MNLQRGYLLAFILCLALAGCGPGRAWATARIPTPTIRSALSGLADVYYCAGHENGMIAGFGQFSITPSGELNDGQKDWSLEPTAASGHFAFVDHPQFAELVIVEGKTFTIQMKPGQRVAHADDGYVWCSKSSP